MNTEKESPLTPLDGFDDEEEKAQEEKTQEETKDTKPKATKNTRARKILKNQGIIDVRGRYSSRRSAKATATVHLGEKAYHAILDIENHPNGNVLETAKVAGIMAAKSTAQLIPMCHPIELSKANVSFEVQEEKQSLVVTAEVGYHGRTGVETEALVAVSAASLTVFDMMKSFDKTVSVTDIALVKKPNTKPKPQTRKK